MSTYLTHPGRSLEFLSRLHDGELSPAERAHFESHRAHCSECRKASAEFEAALSFYRRAGTPPVSTDLASRILRRLETASPRRAPFGVVSGIDLKWAGAFTAALLVVILGYALLGRPQTSGRIRVVFVTPAPAAPGVATAPRPVRIAVVDPLDGRGASPAILNGSQIALSPEDVGQYVLIVSAKGVPIEVARSDAGDAAPPKAKVPGASLRRLRFAPGEGQRRLLLRVE